LTEGNSGSVERFSGHMTLVTWFAAELTVPPAARLHAMIASNV
jgi:hypothetical protein